MLDKSKTDAELGKKVAKNLVKNGVQTPMVKHYNYTEEQKLGDIRVNFEHIMKVMGLDLKDDSLKETPRRIAKMFVNELFWGLQEENFPKITTVENKMRYDEIIVERDINVMSNCEHHFVTIMGKAHIAYIPNKKVLGLSKMNRIVEYFAKRPQIQERLTEQIYSTMVYLLGTKDVAVIIDAEHLCVKSRGVEDIGSSTVTSKMGGRFRSKPEARAELMKLIHK